MKRDTFTVSFNVNNVEIDDVQRLLPAIMEAAKEAGVSHYPVVTVIPNQYADGLDDDEED